MLERGRISHSQMAMTMILGIIGTAILFIPGLTITLGGRDAWLAPIVGGAIGTITVLTMVKLHQLYPGRTPVEYMQEIFGKWFGSFLAAYVLFNLLRYYATMLREFTDFTITVATFRTPPEVILLLMLMVVYYGARRGLEVIVRVAQLVLIIELFQLLVSVISLSTKDIHWDYLTPLFENGPFPVLRAGLLLSAWFAEFIVIGFLLPFVKKPKNATKSGLLAVGCTTVLLIISSIFTLGIFGDVVGARLQFGLYEVGRYVSIANFLERLDPIVMGVWIMLLYCKVALFGYVLSLGTAQLLRIRDYRPLVGIVCLAAGVMSAQIHVRQSDLTHFFLTAFPLFGFWFGLLIPLAILGVAMLRRRGRRVRV